MQYFGVANSVLVFGDCVLFESNRLASLLRIRPNGRKLELRSGSLSWSKKQPRAKKINLIRQNQLLISALLRNNHVQTTCPTNIVVSTSRNNSYRHSNECTTELLRKYKQRQSFLEFAKRWPLNEGFNLESCFAHIAPKLESGLL